jgi:aminoglycoside phosphotransferase (APT) family kinase protein
MDSPEPPAPFLTSAAPAHGSPAPLARVCRHFCVRGGFIAGSPHGNGHINDTYAVTCDGPVGPIRYILQRINDRVFQDVPALMSNIQRVTQHAAARLATRPRAGVERAQALQIVPTLEGAAYHRDETGGFWRCYDFIEQARTYDRVQHPQQAREAAFAFGTFQGLLADLAGPRLHETIPDFHHTRRRFETLRRAVGTDRQGRAAACAEEISFAFSREALVDVLLDLQARGELPERITHNDTKLNNVMLDDATGRGVCVIDLDTVMPGVALYDFGDMVRSATNAALEDETDLSRVHLQLPVFAAVVEGYLASARDFLNAAEIAHLVFSSRLITFEIGLRFLTDFLEGDVYFKISRPRQNLDRCRCQFALLRSMEAQAAEMNQLVNRLTR